ncbi:transposase [Catenulispora sp. GP43]|uniref:transposase n=1 Tax=Catenulispora sp. GP43 TaxID=3156263 RepID=UPI003512434A
MRPLPSPPVPVATAALARAVFPVGCLAMRLRDELGVVFTNADFTGAYPRQGGPALSPVTLALVSVLQYAERLTDRQAVHAAPHLIMHVVTTTAPTDDAAQTLRVEHDLISAGRGPAEHLVDAGYMGAELIVEAAHLGIDLVGPVPIVGGRQEREGRGYGLGDFTIDFDAHTATCPQGKTSTRWIDTIIDGHPRIHVDFYNAGCPACPAKPDCTKARYRGLTLHPREQHEALQQRRREQDTDTWRKRYATRAGVEGTIAQAVHACDARRSRYKGLPKVRLEHILLATAINLIRLDAWWTGTPLGPTRTSHYARLELAA